MMKILITDNKKDEDFLRKKLGELDLKKEDPKELRQLGRNMRKTMNEASGIGLSANQVGVSKRLFVAQVPDKEGVSKFYVVINPKIIKKSSETSGLEEGCLSIPKKFGMVERPTSIMVEGFNISAKKIFKELLDFLEIKSDIPSIVGTTYNTYGEPLGNFGTKIVKNKMLNNLTKKIFSKNF